MTEKSIAASIIDLHVEGTMEKIRTWAENEYPAIKTETAKGKMGRLRSLAFVVRCVEVELDFSLENALETITDGANDLGIDALNYSEPVDNLINIEIFQGKYSEDLRETNFPENAIIKLVHTLSYVLNVNKNLPPMSRPLAAKLEEIRSFIKQGNQAYVRVYACNNGLAWNKSAQTHIDNIENKDSVEWIHVNHDSLFEKGIRKKNIDEVIQLEGEVLIEKRDFRDIVVGRVPATEIARIMKEHGDRLLEKNIRRFLGFGKKNTVNNEIMNTLVKNPREFYYYNNGITIICSELSYNLFQRSSHAVRLKDMNIVNGGQTCMTILKTQEELRNNGQEISAEAGVLVRIYKLDAKERNELIDKITYSTNSQNSVDLKDLRSNDVIQKKIEENLKQFDIVYVRSRGGNQTTDASTITSATAAQAILAVWRRKPDQAKFRETDHFGKLYKEIFNDQLNAIQIITAVSLFRYAENRRKRPRDSDPEHVFYSSAFVAMLMGQYLLAELGISLEQLTHQKNQAEKAVKAIEDHHQEWVERAINEINQVLQTIYQPIEISNLQKLSAKFRRNDLVEYFFENTEESNP